MMQLLETYSVTEILTFVVLLALAVKGVVTFYDWGKERLGVIFGKETKKQMEKISLEQRFQKNEESIEKIKQEEAALAITLNDLSNKIDLLIESDKDDIKAWITEKHHHHCYEKGWIDDYTMDCIEKRFKHYEDEGGNSFIANLMDEIRNLDRRPHA